MGLHGLGGSTFRLHGPSRKVSPHHDDPTDLSVESLAANQGERKTVINEEDVDKFIENEKESAEQAGSGVSTELKPEIGMEFKTREEAQQYLNMYSFSTGFSIAVVLVYHTTSKKRNNEVTRPTIKCNKHGHN